MTLEGRKVKHLEKKGTQRVQGSIGLSHLSYVLQIDTWRSSESVSTSGHIGYVEVRN